LPPGTIPAIGGKVDGGKYLLLDSFVKVPRTTTFGFAAESPTVSVLLWMTAADDKL
jgi:hypothetical protein